MSSPSSSVRVSSGLAANTEVRTSTGNRAISDLVEGDLVYNDHNEMVRVIGIGDPYDAEVRKISYRQFDSSREAEFFCTPKHQLSLVAAGVAPQLIVSGKKNSVVWFTPCKRPPTDDATLLMDSVVELGEDDAVRFAACRHEIESRRCPFRGCDGFRRVTRNFQSLEQAQLALNVFRSDQFSVLDPHMVADGDTFDIRTSDFENRLCGEKKVKTRYLKLYRASSSTPTPSIVEEPSTSTMDPYAFGFSVSGAAQAPNQDMSRIPTAIMNASHTDRLRCLAGMIDNTGSKMRNRNAYMLTIPREERRQAAEDARSLAQSVGICSNDIFETKWDRQSSGESITWFSTCLTVGGAQLAPYLRVKQPYEEDRRHYNHDVRPLIISDGGVQTVLPIAVEGGYFQLSNRLVVSS